MHFTLLSPHTSHHPSCLSSVLSTTNVTIFYREDNKKYNICPMATVLQFHQNGQCSVELARTVWVTIKKGHNFLCMPVKSSSPGMSFLKCLQLNDKSALYKHIKQRCGLLKTFYHNPDTQLPYLNLDNWMTHEPYVPDDSVQLVYYCRRLWAQAFALKTHFLSADFIFN